MNSVNFFDLDPVTQFLVSLLYAGEVTLFIGIALLIKHRIKWGKIDPNKFTYTLWGSFIIILGILYFSKQIELLLNFLVFTWAGWLGAWFSCPIFNYMNKDMFVLTLQKWENIREDVTELKMMCYKESETKLVTVRLNEENREPFKDLLKRIFGIKKNYLVIANDAAGWRLNKSGKIYLYRKIMKHKRKPEIHVIAEPDIKSHSVPAFVKAFEGYYSTKNETERVKEENVNLRMQKHYLARIEGRRIIAPLIKLVFPEQWPDFKKEMEEADKEDEEKIEELETTLKQDAEKAEEKLEKDFKTIEGEDLKYYEEDFNDYVW